jgi:Domain of Unknown Function with PDB structure (DUF3857)/Transglutaminase-like superfamily
MNSIRRLKTSLTLSRCLICAFAVFSATPADARWADLNEASVSMEFSNGNIEVKSDGTSIATEEEELTVLNETGQDTVKVRHFFYYADSEDFKILEAKTINGDVEKKVPKNLIEDKAVANSNAGFTQLHQVMIAFPDVKVGSKIYYKIRKEIRRAVVPGFFWVPMMYGANRIEKTGTVTITSELPLYFKKNDPENKLDISIQNGEKRSTLKVVLKSPVYKEVIDEPLAMLDPALLTFAEISTSPNWSDLSNNLSQGFDRVVAQPLPPELQKIYETASKKTSLSNKVDSVVSDLASLLNYLGDWRTTEGKYSPRNLKDILENRQADCKDFAAASVAIFRKLGIDAWVALVKRGTVHIDPKNPNRPIVILNSLEPSVQAFNHAIVYFESDGKKYWIDPTNPNSFGLEIRDDIADRDALILRPKEVGLNHIPAPDPSTQFVEVQRRINMSDPGKIDGNTEIKFKGRAAIFFTGLTKKRSRQEVDSFVAKMAAMYRPPSQYTVDPYDLSSDVVRDLDFKVKYSEKNFLPKDDESVFRLPPEIPLFWTKLESKGRVSGLFIGESMTVKKDYVIEGGSLVNPAREKCRIESPWVDASLDNEKTSTGVRIKVDYKIKKGIISQSELASKDYEETTYKLATCLLERSIKYKLHK